ncbi:MAG: sigma-54-dependent transcriptional regulator [bacterium]
MMTNILIIDRNKSFYNVVSEKVREKRCALSYASSIIQGVDLCFTHTFHIIFLKSRMPDGHALDALPKIMDITPHPEVIVMSESANPEEAELMIKNGAWDYFELPSNPGAIDLIVIRVLQYNANKVPKDSLVELEKNSFEGIIGESLPLRSCLEIIIQAAKSDSNVLITGETGTGKELFALAIHNKSNRAHKNFVVVDCAALPETLIESTLFGHQKGAFTGADKTQDGLIMQADQGTLFLDEIGEMPLVIQKKFLRVLEEQTFLMVGGRKKQKSDFRIIAATNRNLDTMVSQKQFRKDLLFRLKAFTINLPPLRDRPEDLKPIAIYHMAEICKAYGIDKKEFSPDFFAMLAHYKWPGNVRELVNALERAIVAAKYEPTLFPQHLPLQIRAKMVSATVVTKKSQQNIPGEEKERGRAFPRLEKLRKDAIAEVEKRYLRELITYTNGDTIMASHISGLSRSRLYALLKKYDISPSYRF